MTGKIGAGALCWALARACLIKGREKVAEVIVRQKMKGVRRHPARLTETLATAASVLIVCHGNIIRSACAEGFSCLDFGRSTRQSGTYHFKQQSGAQEEPLFWYRIPIASRQTSDVSASSRGTGAMALSTMWRHLPLPVTRQIGPYLRKYLIQ